MGLHLVTGTSRGIGKAVAEKLESLGHEVIGTATSIPPTDASSSRKTIQVDFKKEEDIKKLCSQIQNLPSLDGLVNNAGINIIKPLTDVTSEDYDSLSSVNLKAPYFISSAAAEKMRSQGKGHIVNIASIWAEITKSQRSLYSTAKSGITGMTRAMAAELGVHNILVNSVSPGFTLTELTRASLTENEMQELSNQIPLRRMATTEEIASLVVYLLTENTYLTGQNIVIDGGFSII